MINLILGSFPLGLVWYDLMLSLATTQTFMSFIWPPTSLGPQSPFPHTFLNFLGYKQPFWNLLKPPWLQIAIPIHLLKPPMHDWVLRGFVMEGRMLLLLMNHLCGPYVVCQKIVDIFFWVCQISWMNDSSLCKTPCDHIPSQVRRSECEGTTSSCHGIWPSCVTHRLFDMRLHAFLLNKILKSVSLGLSITA